MRRLFSLNCRISLTTRSTCRLPFFGGTNFSTSSVKMISPTRSLLRIAENARIAAISAARSRFSRCREPNRPDADMSTTSSTVISRSSLNSFTYASFMRAVTFQSMNRMSSPGM